MAIDVGASVVSGFDSSGTTTTDAITTAGSGSSFVICVVYEAGATEPTISDSKSNSYTRIGSVQQVSTTYSAYAAWYLCTNGTGGSGHTFTAAKASSYPTVFACEITGGVTASLLDQNTGAALDSTSPIASGTITTTQANALLLGFTGTAQNSTGVFTPGNSFTTVQSLGDAAFWTGNLAKRVVSSTGTYESNCAITNLLQGAALVASFKAAGSSASTMTAAAGAATASTMTGRSTAVTTKTVAAGAATAGTRAGKATAVASKSSAAGVATAGTLVGSAKNGSVMTAAAGAATAGSLTGRSTAVASKSVAAGVATAGTLTGSGGGSATKTPAAGVATTGTLTGRSTAVAHFGTPPSLGAHTLLGIEEGSGTDPETTASITTQASGSSLVTFTAGYADNNGGPSDSKGNTWTSAGTEVYTGYGGAFDVRGYYVEQAVGGSGHTVTFQADGTPNGEMTVPFLEVKDAGKLVAVAKNYPAASSPLTSGNVTTTGPAVLVALWWGDAPGLNHTATPNNGFTVVDSLLTLPPNSAVQCAVAVRQVTAPGTYNVTWTETPNQGAPLWLFAFQNADSGADGIATTSTMTGKAARLASMTAAAGVATAATRAGKSTAVATKTAAAGAATAGSMSGKSTAVAVKTSAAGAASAGSLEGRATKVAAMSVAAGVATAATKAGSGSANGSTALVAAAGVATAATLGGKSTAITLKTAGAGLATATTMLGRGLWIAVMSPAQGVSTGATLAGAEGTGTVPTRIGSISNTARLGAALSSQSILTGTTSST